MSIARKLRFPTLAHCCWLHPNPLIPQVYHSPLPTHWLQRSDSPRPFIPGLEVVSEETSTAFWRSSMYSSYTSLAFYSCLNWLLESNRQAHRECRAMETNESRAEAKFQLDSEVWEFIRNACHEVQGHQGPKFEYIIGTSSMENGRQRCMGLLY